MTTYDDDSVRVDVLHNGELVATLTPTAGAIDADAASSDDERIPDDVLILLDMLQSRSEAQDARLPHVVILTEGESNYRQAIGPFPDRAAALASTERMRADIGDPLLFEVMPLISAEGDRGQ